MAATAKLFKNGRSQAVRLPAEFRFEGTEVFIERQGDAVVLRPKPVGWDDFFAAEPRTPDDFLADRDQAAPQERDWFDVPRKSGPGQAQFTSIAAPDSN
jgi:antitoxin VapB